MELHRRKAHPLGLHRCTHRIPPMFREAICHAVGKIDAKQFLDRKFFEDKGTLYTAILELIVKKCKELLDLKKDVEFRITGFYLYRMYHPADQGYVPDRGVYTSDIYLYQARSIVMQYISGAYAKGWHHGAADSGIRCYQTIRRGGDSYCTKESLDSFHARFAMSNKAMDPFNKAMEVMKEEIKPTLDELFVDRSMAEKNRNAKLGYLTCTVVRDEELPWHKLAVEADVEMRDVGGQANGA